ncbi:MAG: histidine kinase [Leptospirillum sp.]
MNEKLEDFSRFDPFLGTILKMGKGRLKIYLGWAPGTGKTRRALLDLRALKDRGVDVVIGWSEENLRSDVVKMLEMFETISPVKMNVGSDWFPEMDLDAILGRHPATVFVDELAHGNVSGSRHQKRWEDIEEILEAGISVVTTLNSMHVQDLSEAAEGILGFPVKEIVPLDFIKRADEVVVVDLPPSELILRIKQGNVFPQEQIERALKGPFRESNLVKLREMTLAFMARVLDVQLTRQGGKKGVYERITVLVSEHTPSLSRLLGYAGNLSRRMGGELLVLHLRTISLFGTRSPLDPEVLEMFHQEARKAGGKFSILWTRNPGWTLWRFIQRTKTTRLVMGHAGTQRPWRKSLVRSVLRYFSRIDVEIHLIPTLGELQQRDPVEEPPSSPLSSSGSRGRLTLFLGAAAGIGKTYRMLQVAHERQENGTDVVVGYLETHRRQETEQMSEGLRTIPRKMVSYHGLVLGEMDMDAILAMKPRLVLVDELAHSNPPEFRNKKRYEDVIRLLEEGIDVFSTLNVQHLESLNDLIEFQTGIRVHETVPDSIVLMADEIVLVDLTAEALQARLMEGKVYPLQKVEEALRNFFTKNNLTALRELAMKCVSEGSRGRVIQRGRGGCVLVGVSDRPEDAALVRRGAVLSDRLNLELKILYVRKEADEGLHSQVLVDLTRSFGGVFLSEVSPQKWESHFIRRCQEIGPSLVLLGQSAWRPGFESTAEMIARNLNQFPLLIIPLDIREHVTEN